MEEVKKYYDAENYYKIWLCGKNPVRNAVRRFSIKEERKMTTGEVY